MSIDQRLAELGITLPAAAAPVASYVPFVEANGLLHVSGQISFAEDGSLIKGRLGEDMDLEAGQAAARRCGIMLLAQLRNALGSLDRVERIVKLGVFVNSTGDFTDQPKVANGASELMQDVFGEAGRHARSAVGVPVLPLGVAVEVDAVVQIRGLIRSIRGPPGFAHRGLHDGATFIENSLPAFAAALERGRGDRVRPAPDRRRSDHRLSRRRCAAPVRVARRDRALDARRAWRASASAIGRSRRSAQLLALVDGRVPLLLEAKIDERFWRFGPALARGARGLSRRLWRDELRPAPAALAQDQCAAHSPRAGDHG